MKLIKDQLKVNWSGTRKREVRVSEREIEIKIEEEMHTKVEKVNEIEKEIEIETKIDMEIATEKE